MRAIIAAVLIASLGGCITSTMYGTEVEDPVELGAPEAAVIAKHGAPDNIIYLGTPWENVQTGERGEVDKYIYEYRIGGGSTILGWMYATDSFKNICYLIEDGKVAGGGQVVGEGSGKMILYFFGEPMHWKSRAGYGGDRNPEGSDEGAFFGLF